MSLLQRICTSFTKQLQITQLHSRTYSSLPLTCAEQTTCQASHLTHLTNGFKQRLSLINGNNCSTSLLSRCMATLSCMHRSGPRKKRKETKLQVLEGAAQKRGVVLKVLIRKPKKPNSANRKCVRVRLSNGYEATAYVPLGAHNLQEHNVVLLRGGRTKDCPGVKMKCVRGKYDLAHVKKKL